MENQINIGDQNSRQINQNPNNQPTNIQNNPRINYWMISTIILSLATIIMVGIAAYSYFVKPTPSVPASEAVLVLHLVDAVTQQPVSEATATLSQIIYCIEMIGADCPKGDQWQATSNASGEVLFTDPTLITKLQKEEAYTSLALKISAPRYSTISREVIFSQTQPPEELYYPDDPNVLYTFLGKEFTIQLVSEDSLNQSSEYACSQDRDCVTGIRATSCCSCPQAVNQALIGTEDWQLYEPGKDYSSQKPEVCDQAGICQPCEPLTQPVCQNGQCRFTLKDLENE